MKNYDSWNTAMNFVMKIVDDFVDRFSEQEYLEKKSLIYMIKKLNVPEYTHFMNSVNICQNDVEHPYHVLIKYSLTKESHDLFINPDSILRECRSIVIDLKNRELVLVPFRKFFNINEIEETSIHNVMEEMKSAKEIEISNKLDGSMQQARYYHGEIIYAGSGTLFDENSHQLGVGKTMLNDDYKTFIKAFPDYTILFEFIHPSDAHVVKYNESGLFLIGMRNVITGDMLSYRKIIELANQYNIKCTSTENISIEKMLNLKDKYKSDEKEGWVIRIDKSYYKFKCDDYVNIHGILSYVASCNVIIKAIADDYFDDLLAKVPDIYRDRIYSVANVVYDYLHHETEAIMQYANNAPDGDRKTIALYIKENVPAHYQSNVFNALDNRPLEIIKFKLYSRTPQYIKMNEITEGRN
jgi:T4 RnlA family RNA ligase